MGRPSTSCPPSTKNTSARTTWARSAGQSIKGTSDALAGKPIRIAATFVRLRRSATALVKWVVPIITASSSPAEPPSAARSSPSAVTIPPVTSSVVAVLATAETRPLSINTASVFVPPTSIPILLMASDRKENRSRDRNRRRAAPHASVLFPSSRAAEPAMRSR